MAVKFWQHKWASSSSSKDNLCETCKKRPKFMEDNGIEHPYCSKTCARNSQSSCKLQGCHDAGKSAFGGYCSAHHSSCAVQHGQVPACSQCHSHPQAFGDLCLACNNLRSVSETRLTKIEPDSGVFRSLAKKVAEEWNGVDSVNIERVFEVHLPHNAIKSRKAYRKKLEGADLVTTLRTFHSAQCICNLGLNDSCPSLCMWRSCGICSILKSGFENFEFGIKYNTGRYGPGIYSFENPALADEFATSSTSSPYRVMIVCEVCIPSSSRSPSSPTGAQIQDARGVFVSRADSIAPTYVLLYTRQA